MAIGDGIKLPVMPALDDAAVKRITAKVDELTKSRDINLNVNGAKLNAELKKAQLEIAKATGDKEVTFKAKADLISAKLASAELSAVAGDSGDQAAESYGNKFSNGIRKFARTGGLWENAIAAGFTAIPAVAAVAGLAGAIALGGAFTAAVIKLDPKVKAAGAALGKSLGNNFITGTKASGFDAALIADFGTLKTKLAGPIQSIAKTLGTTFKPALKDVTNGIVIFADWLANKLPGALRATQSWLGKIPWKSVGEDIKSIGTTLVKIVVPAFQGWESIMGPTVKLVTALLVPILKFLANNPNLVKAIAATVAVMKLWGLANAALVIGLPILDAAIALTTGGIDGLKAAVLAFEESNPFGWIALAIVGIILLGTIIVKYHKQIWAFMVKVWHDIAVLVPAAWDIIAAYTVFIWNDIYKYLKVDAWGAIQNVFLSAIKNIKNWVSDGFNAVKSFIVDPLQTAYDWVANNFVRGIKSAFSGLVSSVKAIWNGLKKVVADPINFVGGIWNKFAGFVNKGLSIFGIKLSLPPAPTIKFAKGGHVPGFAPGVDNVPAMLSPGEFVLRPQAVAAIGVENLHKLNKGTQKFANGGDVVNDIEKWNGHKYVWGGGANPSTGWDCSSFVNYIVGHDFKLNLPGGGSWGQMTNNGAAHGPVAASYNNWTYGRGVPWSGAKKGDLAIEDNGAHIGFIIQDNTSKSSNASLQGFAARSTATGTGYEQFFPSAFHLERFADDRGFESQVFDNTIGAVLKPLASLALNGISGLLTGALNHIPGVGPIPKIAKASVSDVINAAKAKLSGNQNNYQFNNPAATGPAGVGTSAGEIANGKQVYSYLLANLFGGNKIAAAGATASIWGESTWNPFAQGTGGRGLIGWTPPGTISNSDFLGGMATQLPAILRFVVNSGDSGVIAEMFRATSVTQAANEWGRGVERFGINDVHPEGLSLATSFMANGGLIPSGIFDNGGTLAPGPNLVHNLTGKPEHLTNTTNGNGIAIKLELGSSFRKVGLTKEQLEDIRYTVRTTSGGDVQKTFGRKGH